MKFTNDHKIAFNNCKTQAEFNLFLADFEINAIDESSKNILHYYLISLIYDSNIEEFAQNRPYLLVPIPIIDEMLKKGIHINAQPARGAKMYTALCLCVDFTYKSKEIFDHLLKNGADVNVCIGHGGRVLTKAMLSRGLKENNDLYFVEKLLEHGADIYAENNFAVSAFSLVQGFADDALALKNLIMKYHHRDQ
jgi:ankyrin repeat protein